MEPINLLIKPASGNCNMKCKYCFYVDEMQNRTVENFGFMKLEVLEKVIKNALFYARQYCMIAFQGGEPTLVGLDFYKRMIEYVEKYNVNQCKVEYAIQTNGYVIDEKWAKFFSDNHFLVGISLDGNEVAHNYYRVDKAGNGTFLRVTQTIELFRQYQVEFNILSVITNQMAASVKNIYHFYKKQGFTYQQYIECLEPLNSKNEKDKGYLTTEHLACFWKELFDVWYQDMMQGKYTYIRYFENIIMILAGRIPESCTQRGRCGKQWVVESDGSVYPCDFYVLDEWKLGNLAIQSMEEIEVQREKSGFLTHAVNVPEDCKQCKWFMLCRNGCKRNRCYDFEKDFPKNRFCEAYKNFFEYSYSRFLEVMQKYGVPVVTK